MSSEERPRSVMQAIGDDWCAVMDWPAGVEDGGPARLTIQPVGDCPVGGLSSTVLRQIDFRKAIDELRGQIEDDQQRDSVRSAEQAAITQWRAERLQAILAAGVSDDYLALLSWEYEQAVSRGQAKINEHLAAIAGRPVSTIRGHLWQARKRGLLTGSPGRKGGKLGPEAEKIMERIDADWS
ncbi:MAG: hypothetical protein WA942_09195, partial [Mycolicibacter sinensis]